MSKLTNTYKLSWHGPDFYSEYANTYENTPILYKYRTWKSEIHRDALKKPSLYLASPKTFKDPRDCRVPEVFPPKEKWHEIYLRKSYECKPGLTDEERLKFVEYWCRHSPMKCKLRRWWMLKKLQNEYFERFGVLSMAGSPAIEEMWDKYSDKHRGICIGYDKEILEEYVGGAGPVIYTNNLPLIHLLEDDTMTEHIKRCFFKTKRWSFEKEYRVHKIWLYVATNSDRTIILPKEVVKEVVLGRNMSPKDIDEIRSIVKRDYPFADLHVERP